MTATTPQRSAPTLRDRKRDRTRATLIAVATDMFTERGYDQTTVADIAAAADIGTRTFFSYFATKEELLFPESDARVQAAVDAIATRTPDESAADVLLRALQDVGSGNDEMVGPLAALRLRLVATVPAVRGRAMQVQMDAQRDIGRHLCAAFPHDLTELTATALVGAFIGAISGALQVLLDEPDALERPDELRTRLQQATRVALAPWSR